RVPLGPRVQLALLALRVPLGPRGPRVTLALLEPMVLRPRGTGMLSWPESRLSKRQRRKPPAVPHSPSQLFQRFFLKNLHHGEIFRKTVRSCEGAPRPASWPPASLVGVRWPGCLNPPNRKISAMAFKDYKEFVAPLALPIMGKEYEIQPVSAQLGAKLMLSVERAQEIMRVMDENE